MSTLIESMDVPCNVGVMFRDGSEVPVPFFVMDYGRECPPLDSIFRRYKKLTFDIHPNETGDVSYIITSDIVITVVTPAVFDRIMAKNTAKEIAAELTRDCSPEFSVMYNVTRVEHERFIHGQESNDGVWFLIVLTEEALLLSVNRDGFVLQLSNEGRHMFDEVL